MILLSFLFMLAGYLFLILAFAELCSIWAEIPEEIDYYEGYEPAPGEGEDPWEGVDPEERPEGEGLDRHGRLAAA